MLKAAVFGPTTHAARYMGQMCAVIPCDGVQPGAVFASLLANAVQRRSGRGTRCAARHAGGGQ